MPVIVLVDGMIGQMMEGVVLPPEKSPGDLPHRDWTAGRLYERASAEGNRKQARHITSIHLVPEQLEAVTRARFARYEQVKAAETRFEETGCGADAGCGADTDCKAGADCADADLVLAAYGTSARVCLGARKLAEKEGIKLGIFRPITLWPFPHQALGKIAAQGKPILAVEMSLGQLVEDVKLAAFEAISSASTILPPKVHLLGHSGGVIPTEEEVFAEAKRILGK
jgi:2-oxoglutarate ferredoxin oxidoreductase subunit alpha